MVCGWAVKTLCLRLALVCCRYLAPKSLPQRRAPLGVVVQDLYVGDGRVGLLGGKGGGLVKSTEKFALSRAKGVVAIHDRFVEQLADTLDIPRNRITVVRNWTHIEPPSADRQITRSKMGWNDDTVVVLHAGNMGAKQGLESVVDAASLVGKADKKASAVCAHGQWQSTSPTRRSC